MVSDQQVRKLKKMLSNGKTLRESALKAGCGRDVAQLIGEGYHAVGVDASQEMVTAGRQRYGLAAEQLLVDELPALPALDGLVHEPFDAVLCAATLQHIPEIDLLDALYRINTLVAPGGFLLISVPLRWNSTELKPVETIESVLWGDRKM